MPKMTSTTTESSKDNIASTAAMTDTSELLVRRQLHNELHHSLVSLKEMCKGFRDFHRSQGDTEAQINERMEGFVAPTERLTALLEEAKNRVAELERKGRHATIAENGGAGADAIEE